MLFSLLWAHEEQLICFLFFKDLSWCVVTMRHLIKDVGLFIFPSPVYLSCCCCCPVLFPLTNHLISHLSPQLLHFRRQCKYTLTKHFIRYTLIVLDWSLPSELFLCGIDSKRYWKHYKQIFTPYWHDAAVNTVAADWLHIHDVNLLFHRILKPLYWIKLR